MKPSTKAKIDDRINYAFERYGHFSSTHEALGVALEEWHELIEQVRQNSMAGIEMECLDLAAVLIRLVESIDRDELKERSVK